MWISGAVRAAGVGPQLQAVHRAYAKHAEVTVPPLDDWEKDWQENPQRNASAQNQQIPESPVPVGSSRASVRPNFGGVNSAGRWF
jgi:hypothetical protein